jgi:hypothetical protein
MEQYEGQDVRICCMGGIRQARRGVDRTQDIDEGGPSDEAG